MWVLALDTTTRDGSVALVRDDDVVVSRPGEGGVTHAERVPHDLQQLLAEGGIALAEIDLFAIATGPGAFTGLRIGVAAVQGLALALNRPAAGIPALEALAWDVLDQQPQAACAGAWLDASRGEVFTAAYRRTACGWPLEAVAPPTAAPPETTIAAWQPVVPPDTAIVVTEDASAATAAHVQRAGWRRVRPSVSLAALVGRLAVRDHRRGVVGPPSSLAPAYVRRPDVELERERRTRGASVT